MQDSLSLEKSNSPAFLKIHYAPIPKLRPRASAIHFRTRIESAIRGYRVPLPWHNGSAIAPPSPMSPRFRCGNLAGTSRFLCSSQVGERGGEGGRTPASVPSAHALPLFSTQSTYIHLNPPSPRNYNRFLVGNLRTFVATWRFLDNFFAIFPLPLLGKLKAFQAKRDLPCGRHCTVGDPCEAWVAE